MINILNKDSLRKYIEKVSNGRVTVLYDRFGIPSIMVVIPKMKIKDILPAFADEWKLNKKFNPFSTSVLEQGIFVNNDKISGDFDENSVHPAFRIRNEDGSYKEVPYIFVGMFKSNFNFNHSLPLRDFQPYLYSEFDKKDKLGNIWAGNFLDDPYNYLNEKQKISSYENIILRTFLKNNPGSSSWRPVNIWVFSLIRLLAHFSSPFKYRFPHGTDLYGNKIYKYEYNKETGLWDSHYKLGSPESFTGVRSNMVIFIPANRASILEEVLRTLLKSKKKAFAFDKFGSASGYIVGMEKVTGLPNFRVPTSQTISEYLSGYLYRIYLEETKGRFIDFGYTFEDLRTAALQSNNPDYPNDNIEREVYNKVNSIFVNSNLIVSDNINSVTFEYFIVPDSFQYESRTPSLDYKDYVSIPRDIEEYKFDKDSEFYRIFGVGDIITSLISTIELVDGLFLKSVYSSDRYGLRFHNTMEGSKYTFIPIVHDCNFKEYKTFNGKLMPYYYYTPYDYMKKLNINNLFSGEFFAIEDNFIRLPFELIYDEVYRELNWRFTYLPKFNYRDKYTYITSLPLYYDENGRNIIWRSFLDFMDEKNPTQSYSENRLFLIVEEYQRLKILMNSQKEIESTEVYAKISKDIDINNFIKEFRLFLLSGLVHGIHSNITEEVVAIDKDTTNTIYNVVVINRKDKEYFSEPVSDIGAITSIRYRGDTIRAAYPPARFNTVSGEFFYYRGLGGLANWTSNSLEPWKERVVENKKFRGLGLGGNNFTLINLFDYRLLYLPGV